jgi:predicted DNA-binding transcriptional regulator YafY
MKKKDIYDALQEYVDKFDENLPVYMMTAYSEEQLIDKIEKAIKTGKKIKIEYRKGNIY